MSYRTILRCSSTPLLFAAIISCADRAATAPDTDIAAVTTQAPSSHTEATLSGRGTLIKRTVTINEDVSVQQTITPSGGFIMLPASGLIMYFPQGAVASDVSVTVTARKGNRVLYSFAPHGITFNTPVYVLQNVKGTELDVPPRKRPEVHAGYISDCTTFIHTDGTADFSEVMPAAYYGKKKSTFAYFTIRHFSGYALASGRVPSLSNGF